MPHVTLGKRLIISSIVSKLGVNQDILSVDPVCETMRLASTKKEETARIIAIACAKDKVQTFDEQWVGRQTQFFRSISTEDRAALLHTVLSYDRSQGLCQHFGIDKEIDDLRKTLSVKKDSADLTFCGKSIWGQLIDPLCERYGWTLDYILWGISYNNLQMLMSDQVKTVFLSDEERKKLHLPERGTTVYKAEDMTAEEMRRVLGIKE